MGNRNNDEHLDPWLTLGEIAEELRVNPATVRLWVRKGQLAATRAGMRKWLVRRSEVERMLAAGNRTAQPRVPVSDPAVLSGLEPEAQPAECSLGLLPPTGARESVKQLVELADHSLAVAFTASALAPPSSGYEDRLRAIADAFEHLASTLLHAARTATGGWAGRDDWGPERLPYEVRPGGNRPTPEGLWDGFDAASVALGDAMIQTDIVVVGDAFRKASEELLTVADRIADSDLEQPRLTGG